MSPLRLTEQIGIGLVFIFLALSFGLKVFPWTQIESHHVQFWPDNCLLKYRLCCFFQENDLSGKTPNGFRTLNWKYGENHSEFYQTSYILATDQHNRYFSWQLPGHNCVNSTVQKFQPWFLFLFVRGARGLGVAVCAIFEFASHLNESLGELEHPLATAQGLAHVILDQEILLEIAQKSDKCRNIDLIWSIISYF